MLLCLLMFACSEPPDNTPAVESVGPGPATEPPNQVDPQNDACKTVISEDVARNTFETLRNIASVDCEFLDYDAKAETALLTWKKGDNSYTAALKVTACNDGVEATTAEGPSYRVLVSADAFTACPKSVAGLVQAVEEDRLPTPVEMK